MDAVDDTAPATSTSVDAGLSSQPSLAVAAPEAPSTTATHADPNPANETESKTDGPGDTDAAAKVEKKPMLISRKADFNVAEMMRQLREGEVERSVQPKVKTTNVVKKEKKPMKPQARPTQTLSPAERKGQQSNIAKQHGMQDKKTVVVVATDVSERATAAAPSEKSATGTYAEKVKGKQSANASTGVGEDALESGRKTPPHQQQPQGQKSTSTVNSAKAAPVKQGSVKKRSKKQSNPPTGAEKAPAPHVTTVKAKMSLEELRALRNRSSAVGKEPAASMTAVASGKEGEARMIDEISDLLLRYCMGGGGGDASKDGKKLNPKLWPKLNDDDGNGGGEASAAQSGATEGADVAAAIVSPEVELCNRLTELCQDDSVTSSTLDLLHELLKHTRVIPLRPQSVDEEDGDTAAAKRDAQAEDASNRRLYAQQIILVLINQMKQKKLLEEQRSQLRELQQQHSSSAENSARSGGTGATRLSAFSAPFVPASASAAQQENGNGSHVTTFAPQSTSSAILIPSIATAGGGAFQRQHNLYQNAGPAASTLPSVQQHHQQSRVPVAAATAAATTTSTSVDAEGDLKYFIDVIRDRLVQSAKEPTVAISQEERRVLKEIQESFKRQQMQKIQQQRQLGSASPASMTSSKAISLSFDANQAGIASPVTTLDGESSASNTHSNNDKLRGQQDRLSAPTTNRTVFTYKTLIYDPSNSSAEDMPGLVTDKADKNNSNSKRATTTVLRCSAKPFIPAPSSVVAPTAMNVAAPAFVPASFAHASDVAAGSAYDAPSSRGAGYAAGAINHHDSSSSSSNNNNSTQPHPWASPQMFAEWKKSMEDYYRSLTFSDFEAAMRQQQSHR